MKDASTSNKAEYDDDDELSTTRLWSALLWHLLIEPKEQPHIFIILLGGRVCFILCFILLSRCCGRANSQDVHRRDDHRRHDNLLK